MDPRLGSKMRSHTTEVPDGLVGWLHNPWPARWLLVAHGKHRHASTTLSVWLEARGLHRLLPALELLGLQLLEPS